MRRHIGSVEAGWQSGSPADCAIFARDLISGLLNAIYAQNIPWDSVVVLVLRKKLV